MAVQVNGRLRGRVSVPAGSSRDDVMAAALQSPNVQRHLAGGTAADAVFLPDRIINLLD